VNPWSRGTLPFKKGSRRAGHSKGGVSGDREGIRGIESDMTSYQSIGALFIKRR